MVEVGPHVAWVKVHDGRPVGFFRVCVVVHVDDDNNVIANMALPFQLKQDGRGINYYSPIVVYSMSSYSLDLNCDFAFTAEKPHPSKDLGC